MLFSLILLLAFAAHNLARNPSFEEKRSRHNLILFQAHVVEWGGERKKNYSDSRNYMPEVGSTYSNDEQSFRCNSFRFQYYFYCHKRHQGIALYFYSLYGSKDSG